MKTWNFEQPIYAIVGIVVLFAIYVALFPTLVNSCTSLAALTGLGGFSTIIGTVAPIVLGAVLLITVVKKVMALNKH